MWVHPSNRVLRGGYWMGQNYNKEMLDLLNTIWEKYPQLRFNQLMVILQTGFDEGKWVEKVIKDGLELSLPDLFNAPDEDFISYLEEVVDKGL